MAKRLRAARKNDSDLRGREIQILIKLRHESLRVANLIDVLGMQQTNISKALMFLRKKEYVSRRRGGLDPRKIYYSLTPAGHQYLNGLL